MVDLDDLQRAPSYPAQRSFIAAVVLQDPPLTTRRARRISWEIAMTSKSTRSGRSVGAALLALMWSLAGGLLGLANPVPSAWAGQVCIGAVGCVGTPTESPTPTATDSATPTESPTPTATDSATPTESATPTATDSATPTSTETATPTVTATPTPTATVTATSTTVPTPEPLNHFLCYESHQAAINRPGVELEDQFDPPNDPSTVTVKKAKRLCAPADKNGTDPTAPGDRAHLTAYTIKQTAPKFVRQGPIPVAPDNPDLFPMTVTLTRPTRLLVPAAKNLGTTVPGPLTAPIDHYKCYRVKGATTRLSVLVKTQFNPDDPITVDIKKPIELCTPVDKNGEGINDDVHHLLCYQVRAAAQTPLKVSTNNQFEDKTFDVFGIRELCVPAFKFPGFCGDGALNAPGEKCDGADDSACPGLCQQDCTCAAPPPPLCGNQVVDPGEDCETDAECGTGCIGKRCLVPPVDLICVDCQCVPGPSCGDGVVNQQNEECDDPPNGPSADCAPGTCLDDCTCGPPRCGDNVLNGTDECDGTAIGTPCDGECQNDCTCPISIDEGETCGASTNPGCNSGTPVFSPIACGQTVVGSAWADGGIRDTDWYEISLPDTGGNGQEVLTATLASDFDGVTFILAESACPAFTVLANGCGDNGASITPATTALAAPGTYFVFVSTGDCSGNPLFNGFPCGGDNGYSLTIDCSDVP